MPVLTWVGLPQSSPRLRRCSVGSRLTWERFQSPQEQPRPSEKGESSEIRLEVTPLNMFTSPPPVHSPPKTPPLANEGGRRSPKSPASSGGRPAHPTDAPKRGCRRSSGGPARRASGDRGQQGILQTIHSRRRSGASEANLMGERGGGQEGARLGVNLLLAASVGKFHPLFPVASVEIVGRRGETLCQTNAD